MELFAVQIELSELTQVIWTKSVFVWWVCIYVGDNISVTFLVPYFQTMHRSFGFMMGPRGRAWWPSKNIAGLFSNS